MTDDELNEAIHQIVAAEEYRTYGLIIYIPDYANDLNASMGAIGQRWPNAVVVLEPRSVIHQYAFPGLATIFPTWDDMREYAEGEQLGEGSGEGTHARRLAGALLEALEDDR